METLRKRCCSDASQHAGDFVIYQNCVCPLTLLNKCDLYNTFLTVGPSWFIGPYENLMLNTNIQKQIQFSI